MYLEPRAFWGKRIDEWLLAVDVDGCFIIAARLSVNCGEEHGVAGHSINGNYAALVLRDAFVNRGDGGGGREGGRGGGGGMRAKEGRGGEEKKRLLNPS